VSPGVAPLN
jgi:hypothetical protein